MNDVHVPYLKLKSILSHFPSHNRLFVFLFLFLETFLFSSSPVSHLLWSIFPGYSRILSGIPSLYRSLSRSSFGAFFTPSSSLSVSVGVCSLPYTSYRGLHLPSRPLSGERQVFRLPRKNFFVALQIMSLDHVLNASRSVGGRFGIELTFTCLPLMEHARNEDGEKYAKLYQLLFDNLIEKFKKDDRVTLSEITKDKHGYDIVTIRTKDVLDETKTIELYLHSDDWVFEVGGSPLTSIQVQANLEKIQDIVFGTAGHLGLYPHSRVGCGHLHLEYSSHFHGDAKLFRNFLVDLFNRPELFLGGLSRDLLNSPPVSVLPKDRQDELVKVIDEFDNDSSATIQSLCKAINERVYIRSYVNRKAAELQDFNKRQSKYHAINFLHEETVELRGMRPQASAAHLLTLMKLFEFRLHELRELTSRGELIALTLQDLTDKVSWSVERNMEYYQVKIEPEVVLDALKQYVMDSNFASETVDILITDEVKSEFAEEEDKKAHLPHGTLLGTTDCGVSGYAANYSNYHQMKPEDFKSFYQGFYTGVKWQCVEYARRYWLHHFGVLLRNIPMAHNIWDQHFALKLPVDDDKIVPMIRFENGGNESPRIGDLFIYDKTPDLGSGHVAVVVAVTESYVRLAEQNRYNGRIWPGNYAYEVPLRIGTLNIDGNQVRSYFADDTDCIYLLGWVRLEIDKVYDRPKWHPRVIIDEATIGNDWTPAQKFLDCRPDGNRRARDLEALQVFLNQHNKDFPEDYLEVKNIDGTFDSRTVIVLQKFLSRYWKLSAPDGFADESSFKIAHTGVLDDETYKGFLRLSLRVGTHQEFDYAARSL